jgi:hypothetical protein
MNMHASEFSSHIGRLRRDPHSVGREAAARGERVVGYVGNDIPVAVILAADALPVRVRGNPDAPTSRADLYVETSFSPELRVIADQWIGGALDHLDAIVFARGDDSGQRLYYYLSELQRRGLCAGPAPLLFDCANLPRDSSVEHTRDATRLLLTQLDARADRLDRARQRVKQRDDLVRAARARRLLPAPLPGTLAWAFEYAAACDWRPAFDDSARAWLEQSTLLPIPRRALLTGDALPDDQVHAAIEACGASVVLELTESQLIETASHRDPLAAVAAEYQSRETPVLSMRRNPRWLVDNARDARADLVIAWLSEQDEAMPWEIARQMQALSAAGIPALLLSRQPWATNASVITQIIHFARGAETPR